MYITYYSTQQQRQKISSDKDKVFGSCGGIRFVISWSSHVMDVGEQKLPSTPCKTHHFMRNDCHL